MRVNDAVDAPPLRGASAASAYVGRVIVPCRLLCGRPPIQRAFCFFGLDLSGARCLQCFDAVGWAAGRASGV